MGVVLSTYGLPKDEVPADYRLRGEHLRSAEQHLFRYFVETCVAPQVGDLLLLRVCADQLHFAVQCGASFIHADAGLRRVVEVPGTPPWPLIGTYRPRRY